MISQASPTVPGEHHALAWLRANYWATDYRTILRQNVGLHMGYTPTSLAQQRRAREAALLRRATERSKLTAGQGCPMTVHPGAQAPLLSTPHPPVAHGGARDQVQAPSHPGPHHPHAALQSFLRLLQRVRQSLRSRAHGRDAAPRSTFWPSWAPASSPSAAANRLLHPDLDEIIRAIRSHGAIATIITNGYLLDPGANSDV